MQYNIPCKFPGSSPFLTSFTHCDLFHDTEPVGSVPPRLPPKSKFDSVHRLAGRPVAIVCDAQSHPVPIYR